MSAKSITLPACFQADLPERLAAAGTPFLFLSGNDANRALAAFADRTVITKPIDFAGLLGALETLIAG